MCLFASVARIDLTRIDASQNVRRFYRIEISPGLFGDWSLIREWDRIGQPGQVRVDWYETEAGAKDARFDILVKKAKRGYEQPQLGPGQHYSHGGDHSYHLLQTT